MCWESKSKNRPTMRTARKDIKVIKFLERTQESDVFLPPYYTDVATYKLGKVEESILDEPIDWRRTLINGRYNIERGLHSYSANVRVCAYNAHFNEREIVVYQPRSSSLRNFHSCLDYWFASDKLCLTLAVIPKGSHYYLNGKGEYVSDKLKIVKYFGNLKEIFDRHNVVVEIPENAWDLE